MTRPLRVAMVVGNSVTGDSRVHRVAAAAVDAGHEALVVGRSPGLERQELEAGGASVVLVPVTPRLTTGAADRGGVRRDARSDLRLRDAAVGGRRRPWARGAWRLLDPWVQDLELALAPEVEAFRPDVVHAHDRHVLGLAARSTARLGREGRPVAWVYDAHEDVTATAARGASGLRGLVRRRMVRGEEQEWGRCADAVVTVSDPLADELQTRLRRPERPVVVLNSPFPSGQVPAPSLRGLVGVTEHTPLLVYAGGCAPQRGVADLVVGLRHLPGVHAAVVCSRDDRDADVLERLARDVGVGERFHRTDYVSPEQVVALLAGADAGVVPLLHRPNHEVSLVTKYLEYVHAGLPVVCSDVREMARVTRHYGLGVVYPAGDPHGLARAAAAVLADPASRSRVRSSPLLASTAWPRQAERLTSTWAAAVRSARARQASR